MCFLSAFAFSIVTAEDVQKYQMVDLGIFGTEESYAHSINDKGQVLGTCKEAGTNYLFFWDELSGLTLIDQPIGCNSSRLKFNNNGQIAGISYNDSIGKIFLWDPNLGFRELESSKEHLDIVALNDKGQILGEKGGQIFIIDHRGKTDLTKVFKEEMTGNWASFRPLCLNNHGHVIFSATKKQEEKNDDWGVKSFLWINGCFKMVMPEKDWNTCVNVECLDDEGNMIVSIHLRDGHRGGHICYFIDSMRNTVLCSPDCFLLKNGFPISGGCLPGKLKRDSQGQGYYTKGSEIKKFFTEEYPYYNVANTTRIRDQNSKGHIVGEIETMFPGGSHAFLAIPIKNQSGDKNEES